MGSLGRAGLLSWQVLHLCTVSVRSTVILDQYMICLAVFVIYWIPRCDACALAVISALIDEGMMMRVPRRAIPF